MLKTRKMSKQEQALHSFHAGFMRDAEPGVWVELPGGKLEGKRIPDYVSDDGQIRIVGNWSARPKGSSAG